MFNNHRKNTRLKGFDYSTPGSYFITVCVHKRMNLLGKITESRTDSSITLSSYGIIAEKVIEQMDAFYDHISVDNYVIMPNHIHFLLTINKNSSFGTQAPANSVIAKFISTFKRFCNAEYKQNIWQRLSNDHIVRNDDDYYNIFNYIDTNVARWKQDKFYI